MVFFVCGACGSSLKKNQVEHHSYKCRGCQYMTCMDCSKDFWGNEYTSHTTCLTEDQKYGGSNYQAKEMKGKIKQDAWIAQIKHNVENKEKMSPALRRLFENILRFENIPRKQAKFMNFLRNNNYKNEKLVLEAWKYFEQIYKNHNPEYAEKCRQEKIAAKASKAEDGASSSNAEDCASSGKVEDSASTSNEVIQAESQTEPRRKSKKERKEERQRKQTKVQKINKGKRALDNDDDDSAGTQETEKPKKKKKKKGREEDDANQENEEPGVGQDKNTEQESDELVESSIKQSPFKWKRAINTVLQDAPEEGMKMKKLKRKLFALYMESKIDAAHRKSDLEVDALISKKLQMRNDKYLVIKDRVKLKNEN